MKKTALTGSVVALFLGTTGVFAQAPADEHAGHHLLGATTPATPPAIKPSAHAMGPAAMPRMQDNMKKMQDLMARIHASKSPTERQ